MGTTAAMRPWAPFAAMGANAAIHPRRAGALHTAKVAPPLAGIDSGLSSRFFLISV